MRQSILSPDSSGHPEGEPAWAEQWAPRVPPRTLFIIAQTPSLACQPRPACSLGRYWGGESFRSDESHRNQLRELMKRTKKRVCLTAGWQARLDLSSSRGDGDKDRVIPRGAPCPHYGAPTQVSLTGRCVRVPTKVPWKHRPLLTPHRSPQCGETEKGVSGKVAASIPV